MKNNSPLSLSARLDRAMRMLVARRPAFECMECGGAPSRGCYVHIVREEGEPLRLCPSCRTVLTPRGPLPVDGKLIYLGNNRPRELDPRRHRFYQAKGGARALFDSMRIPRILIEGPANTGKTRAVCEYVNWLCSRYRLRALFLRQTLQSLRESVQVTLEQKGVLHEGHPVLAHDLSLEHRRAYSYPTGSRIVLGGLDKPEKLFSTEYDIIVIFEAIETAKDAYEKLYRANRNHFLCRSIAGLPTDFFDEEWLQEHDCVQQIIADTNPGARGHYLNQYAEQGVMSRIRSRHEDNPACTPQDLEKLRRLTGPRRDRLYLGLWVGQSGLVWANYSPDEHLIAGRLDRSDRIGCYELVSPEWQRPRLLTWFAAGFDFGYTNPGCLQVFGFDDEDRAYRVAEVYYAEKSIDWWAERCAALWRRYHMRAIVCDNARPDSIRDLNDRIGPLCRRKLPGIAIACDKRRERDGEKSGIDHVRQRLDKRSDGTYGIYLLRDSFPFGIDQDLREEYAPTCLEEEIVSWIYRDPERVTKTDQREEAEPLGVSHACDATRYLIKWAWARNLSETPEPMGYPTGSLGAILRHDEVLGDGLGGLVTGGAAGLE